MNQDDFNITVATSLGRIESKIDGLAGPEGRIAALEKAAVRQWWFTIAIAPVLAAIHAVMRYFKLNV